MPVLIFDIRKVRIGAETCGTTALVGVLVQSSNLSPHDTYIDRIVVFISQAPKQILETLPRNSS
jgi:hypothetical protein